MSRILATAMLIAITAPVAPLASASGYGPAPFYRPYTGSPASQHGPTDWQSSNNAEGYSNPNDVGGVDASTSQSGNGEPSALRRWIMRHQN